MSGLIFEFWCSPQNPLTKHFNTLWNEMHSMCIWIRFITEGPCVCFFVIGNTHSFIHSQLINPSSNRLIRRKKRKTTSIYLLFARIRSPILYPVFLSHRQPWFDLLLFQVSKQQRPPHPSQGKQLTVHRTFLLDVTRTYNTTTEFDFILLYKIKHPDTYYVLISLSIAR